MYTMSQDTPRQWYAELVETRAGERLARTCSRSTSTTHRPTVWRALARRVLHTGSLAQLAKG